MQQEESRYRVEERAMPIVKPTLTHTAGHMSKLVPIEAEILLYRSDDGSARVDVRFVGENAWLSLRQMPTCSSATSP